MRSISAGSNVPDAFSIFHFPIFISHSSFLILQDADRLRRALDDGLTGHGLSLESILLDLVVQGHTVYAEQTRSTVDIPSSLLQY
jgi:hypothetical protein